MLNRLFVPYLLLLAGGSSLGERCCWTNPRRHARHNPPRSQPTTPRQPPQAPLRSIRRTIPRPSATTGGPSTTPPPTIKDFVERTPELSTLVAALNAVNMTDLLRFVGPIILFAANNETFESLMASYGVPAADILAEPDLLARLAQYHVVVDDDATCDTDGEIENGISALGGLPPSIKTGLPGEFIGIDATNGTVRGASGNSANVESVWVSGNGVTFVIDQVLLPTEDDLARVIGIQKLSQFGRTDADGDGKAAEDELRAAAEDAGIVLTEAQVASFLEADVDGDGVDAYEYANWLTNTVLGRSPADVDADAGTAPSAEEIHASLDGDGDGCVTEAELRAAAEARDIVLTEEQVQEFMALEADGDCVGLEAYLNSVDGSVEGTGPLVVLGGSERYPGPSK